MAEKLRLEVWLPKAIKKDIEVLSRTGLPVRAQDLYDRALRVHKVQWLTYRNVLYELVKKGEVFEVTPNTYSLEKPKRIYVAPPLKTETENKVASANERPELIKRLRDAVSKLPSFTIKWADIHKMSTVELREVVTHIEKQVASATSHNPFNPQFVTAGDFEKWLRKQGMSLEEFRRAPQSTKDFLYAAFKREIGKGSNPGNPQELTEYVFELANPDKAVELEVLLDMVGREKAKLERVVRSNKRVWIEAKLE